MGLFTNILSSIGKVANIINPVTTLFNPLGKIRQTAEVLTQKNITPSKAEATYTTISSSIVGGAIGGAVAGPVGAIKGAGVGASIATAQNIISASPKTQEKVTKTITSAPSSLSNFAQNIGEFIGTPSLENAGDIVKENPLLSAGVAIAGGATLLKGAGGLLVASKILGDDEINVTTPTTNSNLPVSTGGSSSLPSDAGKPITPQTQTISAGRSTTKRRKKRITPKQPSINIRIDDRDIYNVSNRKLFKGARSR